MANTPVIDTVRALVAPIVSDLDLDLYDLEQRGSTLRITVDTPPGAEAGIPLDTLALVTRLISREMDHQDPIPGKYTLEVTSPGVERTLRTPAQFQREIGKIISVRLANVDADQRRFEGVLVSADETSATIEATDDEGVSTTHTFAIAGIDRARTVFVWGPKPKPGKGPSKKKRSNKSKKGAASKSAATRANRSKKGAAPKSVAKSATKSKTGAASEPTAKKEQS